MRKWFLSIAILFAFVINGCSSGGIEEDNLLKAVNDSVVVNEDSNVTIDVLANDTKQASIDSISKMPDNGVASIVDDKVLYVPKDNYNGVDSFTYIIKDGDKRSEANVTITVKAVNDAPNADAGEDKTTTVNEAVHIVGSGSNIDGNIVSYLWKEGSDTLATTAEFDYTSSSSGEHTLTLTVTDNNGSSATDSMVVTVEEGYTGAVAPGDFARFYISSDNTLIYHVTGGVYGDSTRDIPVNSLGGVFYQAIIDQENTLELVVANNLGIGILPVGDTMSLFIGLKVPGEVDEAKLVGKTYIYAQMNSNGKYLPKINFKIIGTEALASAFWWS